jgi:hypothetical protein
MDYQDARVHPLPALCQPANRLRDQLGRAQKTLDVFTGVGLRK